MSVKIKCPLPTSPTSPSSWRRGRKSPSSSRTLEWECACQVLRHHICMATVYIHVHVIVHTYKHRSIHYHSHPQTHTQHTPRHVYISLSLSFSLTHTLPHVFRKLTLQSLHWALFEKVEDHEANCRSFIQLIQEQLSPQGVSLLASLEPNNFVHICKHLTV